MPRRRRRKPGGRPTLLDGPKKEALLQALRAGNHLTASAEYAGLSAHTAEGWIRRGEGRDKYRRATEPYVTFAREVRQAKAHAEVYAVTQLRGLMARDARSTIWWLENLTPEWRRRLEADAAAMAAALPPPSQPQNFILISGETLRRLSDEQIAAERGDSDVDDATRARRAKLVSDSAQT